MLKQGLLRCGCVITSYRLSKHPELLHAVLLDASVHLSCPGMTVGPSSN